MSAMDLDAVRAELREIADDVGEPNYRSDTEHFTSAWANVGRHVPALLAEVERLREHVRILECAVDGCRISCAQWERVAQDAMLRDGLTTAEVMRIERERDEAIAERDRLRAELRRWESGQRRKGLPVVESVPDGLRYAAALVRAQGTEGGDEHDQLLVVSGMRLKALSDAASHLIAERDRYAEVVAAAQAWREMRRATPAKPKPAAAALIAAVDRLGGDDHG